MKERTKLLWAIGSIVLGALISGITYYGLVNYYWVNSTAFLLGFALMAVGIGYLLIQLVFKYFY